MLGRLRVRAKLVLLIAVPLVAVMALAVPLVLDRVHRTERAAETARAVRVASQVGGLLQDLQQERLLSVGYLLAQVDRSRLVLHAAEVTDRITAIRTGSSRDLTPSVVAALNALGKLRELRAAVISRQANANQVIGGFGPLILGLIDALRLEETVDLGTAEGRQVVALNGVLRTDEGISSGAVILAVLVATHSPAVLAQLAAKLAELQAPSSRLLAYATAEQRGLYTLVQEAFLSRVGPNFLTTFPVNPLQAVAPLTIETLFPALDSFVGVGRFVERKIVSDVTTTVSAQQRREAIGAYAVGGLSLLVLFAAIIMSIVFSRAIVRPLNRLTASADRVARLAETELLRVADEEVETFEPARLEAVDVHSEDEIGDLARAFERVQATAAGLVERQAASRRNVAQMFGHVGRRTQNLVGLQLAMIDGLERDEVDTGRLRLLYRLDHLSSRLRRNAGSLVVLSGATGVDEHATPLPLVDVVRLALGEIEDYPRVDVDVPDDLVVALPVTTDLVLVLAELMENATMFSPPDTRVRVSAARVGTGASLTIADRGIGMRAERLATENARLARRERLDLAPTEVLGLFVVGRLARRHRMAIALLPTPGGGVTAEIVLGAHLLVPADVARRLPMVAPAVEGARAQVSAVPAPAAYSLVAGPAVREPAVRQPAVREPAVRELAAAGAALDVGALNRAGRVLSTGRSWNAFIPTQRTDSAPVLPERRELRQRVPGAQIPEGATDPRTAPPPAVPVDPTAARALVEEFESAVERAERDAVLAPAMSALTRRVPGANLPAPGRPNGSAARSVERPPADPGAARELVELFESGVARALLEVRSNVDTSVNTEEGHKR